MTDLDLNVDVGQHRDIGRADQIKQKLALLCHESIFGEGFHTDELLHGAAFSFLLLFFLLRLLGRFLLLGQFFFLGHGAHLHS